MTKTNIHQELKKLRSNYLVSQDHHNREIKKEQANKRVANKNIKMHRLLKKQRRTQYKLEQLEAAQ